ncbi:hypothetical protein RRSWK_01639 [Rhodopirellula sp. SWK7]|nr:hypothetical protein RRSWK_01639 [Rhodopirellula sp. SWK7]
MLDYLPPDASLRSRILNQTQTRANDQPVHRSRQATELAGRNQTPPAHWRRAFAD